jgi:hypothetical protein
MSGGTVKASRLRILKSGSPAGKPVSFDYTLVHDLKSQTGRLSEARVQYGGALARLSGTYDMRGTSVLVVLKLRGDRMPAQDLESLLPIVGMALPKDATLQGGTVDADLVSQGPLENLVTNGSVSIHQTRLTGFDLGAKLATVASLAGIKPSAMTEIEKLSSEIRIAPEGIQLSRLVMIVPAMGELTGYGTIDASHALDFNLLARLNTSASVVSRLTKFGRIKADEYFNIPIVVRGTTANPSFVTDLKGVAGRILGTAPAGKDGKSGRGSPGSALQEALRELLGKKKK